MKLGELYDRERELLMRSLSLCGIKVIVPLSDEKGKFKLSEMELSDQDIQEIHLLEVSYEGVVGRLEEIGFKSKGKIGKYTIYVPSDEILNESGFTGKFEVGDYVMINGFFHQKPAGARAYVYCTGKFRTYIITEHGNTISFLERDALSTLIFIKKTGFIYQYESLGILIKDFESGHFKSIFK